MKIWEENMSIIESIPRQILPYQPRGQRLIRHPIKIEEEEEEEEEDVFHLSSYTLSPTMLPQVVKFL
jgi:hypothetical protein